MNTGVAALGGEPLAKPLSYPGDIITQSGKSAQDRPQNYGIPVAEEAGASVHQCCQFPTPSVRLPEGLLRVGPVRIPAPATPAQGQGRNRKG